MGYRRWSLIFVYIVSCVHYNELIKGGVFMDIVVSQKIKQFRKEKKLTTKQLGDLVGVSDGAISMYESGKRQPTIDTCVKLADVFDVSLDMLVRGKEKDHSEEWSRKMVLNRVVSADPHELELAVAILSYLRYEKSKEPTPGQEKEDNS